MADSAPWITATAGPQDKKHAPATLRNRNAILDVLKTILPEKGTVLEIASGSGEHICHFAQNLPQLVFQPSDYSEAACRSIVAWAKDADLANLLPPIQIDIENAEIDAQFDALLCINLIHIAPWSATQALFDFAKSRLSKTAPVYLYGPYIREGIDTAESNLAFDRSLRSRNPQWGIRNLVDVERIAADSGYQLDTLIEMPANNLSLVFRKA